MYTFFGRVHDADMKIESDTQMKKSFNYIWAMLEDVRHGA